MPQTRVALGAEIEYAVVVSSDVAASDVSLEQLRRLFLFRQRYWQPGLPVTVLISESGLNPGSFLLEQIYQVEDRASLRRLILEKLYQGEIDLAPKIVASDELAIHFVAAGRGLVALVRADRVASDARVKVLSLGGKHPGMEGYMARSEAP